MISQQQVDEIIEKNDIGDVIGEYVKLERKGNGFSGLCPFHNEKTPSFSVHEGKQIYKCFGCGKGGNVVSFIMEAEHLNYPQALEFLAERAGIPIKKTATKDDIDREKIKNDIISVNKIAARYFYDNLKKSREAQRYLYNRGIKFDTVKKFGLGFATEEWNDLYKHFSQKGIEIDPKLLERAGLISSKKGRDAYFDKFRNRIMFPIFDINGNVIAFGGRVMDDSLPKYLNSPETVAYIKGRNLYALNIAKKSQSKTVIIVEGYMDCIAIHKAGIDYAVASLGTALTLEQAKLLKKSFDTVVIGYDSDSAGQKATERASKILESVGLRVKILSLGVVDKTVKDPDEFLRKHRKEDFEKVVDKSKSIIEYKIEILAERFPPTSVEAKTIFLDKAVRVLAKIDDASKEEVYLSWFVKKYEVNKEWLASRVKEVREGGNVYEAPVVKKRIKRGKTEEEEPKKILTPNEIRLDKFEKTLIVILSDDGRLMKNYYEEALNIIQGPSNLFLLNKLKNRFDTGGKIGPEAVLNDAAELPQQEINVVADIISKWLRPPDIEVACKDVIRSCGDTKCEIAIYHLNQTMAKLDKNSEDYKECREALLEDIMKLVNERKKYRNGKQEG